jgi:hypothetical protein
MARQNQAEYGRIRNPDATRKEAMPDRKLRKKESEELRLSRRDSAHVTLKQLFIEYRPSIDRRLFSRGLLCMTLEKVRLTWHNRGVGEAALIVDCANGWVCQKLNWWKNCLNFWDTADDSYGDARHSPLLS